MSDYYGMTCPVFEDMMCLGEDECLHQVACQELYWKVRLDVSVKAKSEVELLNQMR